MISHNFYIVRSTRIKVGHNSLLAKPGAKLEDIKEVYSHEQAINQCSKFLANASKALRCIPCAATPPPPQRWSPNPAAADVARPIKSGLTAPSCMALDCLAQRYAERWATTTPASYAYPKQLEIYPGADRTSMMMVLPNKPGSLYHGAGPLLCARN